MKLKIGGQRALAFAVPVVMVVIVGIIAIAQITIMLQARSVISTVAGLNYKLKDLQLQAYLDRFGTRGYVLTMKKNHLKTMADARTASADDLIAIADEGKTMTGLVGPPKIATPLPKNINDRNIKIVQEADRNDQA